MEETPPTTTVTYTCGARVLNDNVLPNEAVRLSIGTTTEELDIVTARVAV